MKRIKRRIFRIKNYVLELYWGIHGFELHLYPCVKLSDACCPFRIEIVKPCCGGDS